MRTIKFRGKRLGNEEWVYGYYGITMKGKSYIDSIESNISMSHNIVIPETVGQFTGLTDKNGKEIFEGDIVRGGIYLAYEVKWEYEECGWNIGESVRLFEICGNIHDNPELLI